MRLLLDQNLSWRLVRALEVDFPGSAHVRTYQLDRASDTEVWAFARDDGFVVLTKDSDFDDETRFPGPPPKVIHVLIGNASTTAIEELLRSRGDEMRVFDASTERALELLPD